MNFYVEKAKKAMEEGSDSSENDSPVKIEEEKNQRVPSTKETLKDIKKKKIQFPLILIGMISLFLFLFIFMSMLLMD